MEKESNESKVKAAQSPVTKLELSPVTYGLGESVKTGLMGFVGAGVGAALLVRFGGEKFPALKYVGEIPGKIGDFFKKKMGQNADKWGGAIATGFGVGTVVSYLTHIPGLISGTAKVKGQQKLVEKQGNENVQLKNANQVLAEDNARLNEALAQVKRPDPTQDRDAGAMAR